MQKTLCLSVVEVFTCVYLRADQKRSQYELKDIRSELLRYKDVAPALEVGGQERMKLHEKEWKCVLCVS